MVYSRTEAGFGEVDVVDAFGSSGGGGTYTGGFTGSGYTGVGEESRRVSFGGNEGDIGLDSVTGESCVAFDSSKIEDAGTEGLESLEAVVALLGRTSTFKCSGSGRPDLADDKGSSRGPDWSTSLG